MRFGLAITLCTCAALSACGTQPKLQFSSLQDAGAEGNGYPFVVPRTVIRVGVASDKDTRPQFLTVPVAYAADGKTPLQRFLAVDDSKSGLAMTPTTVSSVTYADQLIIKSIGTQTTDNRKQVVDAAVGLLALGGAFAAGVPDCTNNSDVLNSFVIEDFTPVARRAPNNKCWGYSIREASFKAVDMKAFPVPELSNAGSVSWFPIAACKPYYIQVYRCADGTCNDGKEGASYDTVVSASDGMQFKRVPLPTKGSISMHADFCQADVTNEGTGGSDWAVLNQILTDVKAGKK